MEGEARRSETARSSTAAGRRETAGPQESELRQESSARLVVGMGNPMRRDDGIGPRVLEELRTRRLPENTELQVRQNDIFELLEDLQLYNRVLIVDAVDMGAAPGTVRIFSPQEARRGLNADPVSTHGFGLRELVEFAERLELSADFVIVGIQVKDVSLGDEPSPEVHDAVEETVRLIIDELK